MADQLPIDDVLAPLIAAMRQHGRAVLQAPPGAGKTTRVPLALLDAALNARKIVMLEPRRLAARAAAERLAAQLGEMVGQRVGYRMRGETKVSAETRIEVVTEGILTRMLQSHPELTGYGTVIFDEFHERSLNADLGLALTWEIRGALRPDLQLLVMSATLDAAPVAALLDDAPVITSQGQSYPVDLRWLDRPVRKEQRFDAGMARLIADAVAETSGGVLVFLPGEGEIRRVEALLKDRLPEDSQIRPLFGAMPFAAQRAAIAPVQSGRRIVLATSIAETSLTIADIRVVIDGGLSRRARFDPGSGMSRLVTEKVTRAEATQRAGRAGRVAPGICYRYWTRGEDGALAAFPPAEIEAADLTGLALELALWGSADLAFLTPPPPVGLNEARALLQDLGALDASGGMTAHGKALVALPLHPRLAHMLVTAGRDAAALAAILAERDPLRGAPADLGLRLAALSGRYDGPGTADPGVLARVRQEVPRLVRGLPKIDAHYSAAAQAALAFPDRIGLRRKGTASRYILSGGKGAVIAETDPLAGARLIVATDLDGDTREARLRQGIAIDEASLRRLYADRIVWQNLCRWSRRLKQVEARQQERYGALVLDDRVWSDAAPEDVALAMLDGVRDLGLRLTGGAALFRARVELVRDGGDTLPDMSDTGLLDTLDDWLLPHLGGVRSADDWRRFDLLLALRAMLDWSQMQALDRAAPAHYETPLGRRIAVDYAGDVPAIALRLQEMFGVTRHPHIGPVPLQVTLLSPAGRPLQVTQDIPGFWASSYADVRKDMRGQYPRHPWPEDPTIADPTLRAKPRGT